MSQATSTKIADLLDQATKLLDAEVERATATWEKTALKTARGILGRVARDIREMGK